MIMIITLIKKPRHICHISSDEQIRRAVINEGVEISIFYQSATK